MAKNERRKRSEEVQGRKQRMQKVVAISKENACSQLYEELEGKEGRKKIYKLANARKRMATDIARVTAVKDKNGTLLTGDDEVKDMWLGYFDDLLNVEIQIEDLEGILRVQGPIEEIYLEVGKDEEKHSTWTGLFTYRGSKDTWR